MRNVLLLTNETATAMAVTSALQSNGKLAPEDVCRDLAALASRLERAPAPAALVDIDGDPHTMLAGMEPLARRFSETRFVALGGEMQHDLLLAAMQAGARHFLLKQAIGSDLNRVLKQICPDGNGRSVGVAVTILSAGGGCGATTVAVNLAAEMQLLGASRVAASNGKGNGEAAHVDPALIVDLDSHYGAVAAYLGIEGEYGLIDLLNRPGPIDGQLVRSSALAHSETLHALISARRDRLGESGALDAHRLGEAIDACKSAYRWTVIDAPRVTIAAAAELARRSAMTLLLLQLSVKDIRAARRMIAGLREYGIPTNSIRVLGSRYRKRRMQIDPDEARKAMGLADIDQPLGLLSNDYYGVTEAVNLGKPLAQAAPRSDFRRDLKRLAGEIPTAAKSMQASPAAVARH
jgi:pilus assembly protein CpaE